MTNALQTFAEPQGPVDDKPNKTSQAQDVHAFVEQVLQKTTRARDVNGPGDLYLALRRLNRGDGIKRQWYKKM